MRLCCVLALAGLAAFTVLGMTPDPVRACDRVYYRIGPYYANAPVAYYPSPVPAYYAPTYSTSHLYPTQPTYALPPSGYQPPAAGASTQTRPTTHTAIGLYDDRFDPVTLTVAPGTTVRWTNYGRHNHTVTSSAGQWDSGDLEPGQVYSATFNQPGTYEYHCKHHRGMRGTVIVK